MNAAWPVAALSRFYGVQLGKMLNEDAAKGPDLAPYLRNVNVRWDSIDVEDLAQMSFSSSERRQFLLRHGDLLVCEGGEVGRASLWRSELDECYFQKAVHRVRPLSGTQVPRFLYYCLRAASAEGAFYEGGNRSTIAHLTAEQLRSHRFPFPPEEVQRAVVQRLDATTSQIDSLLRARQESLRHLGSKRASVTAAGVAGLWIDGERKTSTVPWLVSVPTCWPEVALKLAARLGSGHTPSRSHPEWWVPEECTVPWITTGEVSQMRTDRIEFIANTRERISPIGLANSSAERCPTGTVVLCRTAASAGYSAIMGSEMATSQDFATWVCGPRLRPRYLLLCLRAMRPDLLGRLAMGSTHKTIYMPDIESIRVPLPPVEEQDRIVEDVHRRLAAIDRAVEAIQRQIELLREHRQALITATVTGQLDVAKGAA